MKHHIVVAITAISLICLSGAAWCCPGARPDQNNLPSWRPCAKAPLEPAVGAAGQTGVAASSPQALTPAPRSRSVSSTPPGEGRFMQVADEGDKAPGLQAQEKRRVPKKDENKNDDDSGVLDALSDCLDMLNFFSDLIEICGDDEGGERAEADEVPIIEGPDEWLFYQGVVKPIDAAVEEAEIWSVAGGQGNGGNVVRVASRGMRLRVIGRSYSLNDYWLYVGAAEQDEVYGWIREKHIVEASESGSEE
jgi:hypothetical protein